MVSYDYSVRLQNGTYWAKHLFGVEGAPDEIAVVVTLDAPLTVDVTRYYTAYLLQDMSGALLSMQFKPMEGYVVPVEGIVYVPGRRIVSIRQLEG